MKVEHWGGLGSQFHAHCALAWAERRPWNPNAGHTISLAHATCPRRMCTACAPRTSSQTVCLYVSRCPKMQQDAFHTGLRRISIQAAGKRARTTPTHKPRPVRHPESSAA
uniref:Uncharacterized protein n=1 Tax=Eutreptiella gymnastica TaxID=73025 RepID=A0A7S4FTD3_9EUGL